MSVFGKTVGLHLGRELTGLSGEVYLMTFDKEFETKPCVCVESKIGISFIDIRDDYSSDDEEFSWVSKNYEVLMRYWNCEISDKEIIDTLKKKEY